MGYTYVVFFDKLVHGMIYANNKCRQVDYKHAVRYATAIQKKTGISNVRIEPIKSYVK